ncbi:MAG: hypothetical protein M3Z24_05630, partial [Chloroflexota bacterium]|nr:hypothetical protein [Chloroflexota bacterium]
PMGTRQMFVAQAIKCFVSISPEKPIQWEQTYVSRGSKSHSMSLFARQVVYRAWKRVYLSSE